MLLFSPDVPPLVPPDVPEVPELFSPDVPLLVLPEVPFDWPELDTPDVPPDDLDVAKVDPSEAPPLLSEFDEPDEPDGPDGAEGPAPDGLMSRAAQSTSAHVSSEGAAGTEIVTAAPARMAIVAAAE